MTVTIQPINASAGVPAYTAQQSRQAWSAHFAKPSNRPLGAYSGRTSDGGLYVTVAGTAITVQPGSAIIDPGYTVYQGAYEYASDANQTLTQAAPHATLPRLDIVTILVNDHDIDGSGLRNAPLVYTAGVAASTPVAPATPARSYLLATLSVPASGGGATTVAMNNTFPAALGGAVVIDSPTFYPPIPSIGQEVYRRDTKATEKWDGVAWRPLSGTIIGTYYATLVAATVGATGTNSGFTQPLVIPTFAFPTAHDVRYACFVNVPAGEAVDIYLTQSGATANRYRCVSPGMNVGGTFLADIAAAASVAWQGIFNKASGGNPASSGTDATFNFLTVQVRAK